MPLTKQKIRTLIQIRLIFIILIISSFFNLLPFLASDQLLGPQWELREALDYQKSAEKRDNLGKAFSLLFWYREQEGMESQAQGAQVRPALWL